MVYKRLLKKKFVKLAIARKIKSFTVCPNKVAPQSTMFAAHVEVNRITGSDGNITKEAIERFLNEFSYYNCNYELGYYISFYITPEDMVKKEE